MDGMEWAASNGKAVRQRRVRQETTMFKSGTLPLNMYRASNYPKGKKICSAPMQLISSHEDCYKRIEEQPIHKAGVEEDEEGCDTDSDSDDPTTDRDDENFKFLPAVTTRSGRMVRIICQEL